MSEPSEHADVTPEKACKILEDGTINGEPLTEKQRGMFGAICGRAHKGFKVHRKCAREKCLCKDCMERLALVQLHALVKGVKQKATLDDLQVGDFFKWNGRTFEAVMHNGTFQGRDIDGNGYRTFGSREQITKLPGRPDRKEPRGGY